MYDPSAELPFAAPPFAPVSAIFKAEPEDFEVHEVPAYLPSGAGEHVYVRFEKRGLDTERAVRAIASVLGTAPRDVGFAGLKDRHAVTTQWASFARRPGRLDERAVLEGASIPGVRILEVARHGNKLRTGHLAGNRFVLRLRGVATDRIVDLERTLAWLATHGTPNYFGAQRFGRDGDNVARARRWIVEGGRPPERPFERKLLVSALQSSIFNALLAGRVRTGELGRIVDGDLVRKEDTGGLFVADDLAEVQARADRFEVSATGPMVGAEMRWPEREARRREEEAMAMAGLEHAHLARFRRAGEGARRPYRIAVRYPELHVDPDGVVISFTLPSGAYATEVIRELTRGGATEPVRCGRALDTGEAP
ncbi:MAG: tRNA pseudouridine(13) synthase TruD [Sandaracinaceae bacterium]